MKLIIIALLVSSCTTHHQQSSQYQLIETSYTCPSGFYVGVDFKCHSLTRIAPMPKRIPKRIKRKIDCKRVLKEINQCTL